MTETSERKTFHIIGRPKPVDPASLFILPAPKFERGDIVRHVKTGHIYRIQRVWRDNRANRLSIDGVQILARRVMIELGSVRHWRFDHRKPKGVRLALKNIVHHRLENE